MSSVVVSWLGESNFGFLRTCYECVYIKDTVAMFTMGVRSVLYRGFIMVLMKGHVKDAQETLTIAHRLRVRNVPDRHASKDTSTCACKRVPVCLLMYFVQTTSDSLVAV